MLARVYILLGINIKIIEVLTHFPLDDLMPSLLGLTILVNSEFAPVSYVPQELLEYFHVSFSCFFAK